MCSRMSAVLRSLANNHLSQIVLSKEDVWTIPDDVQMTHDLIPRDNKKLHWIEESDTRRFFGYNFFDEHPETMTAGFDKYVS